MGDLTHERRARSLLVVPRVGTCLLLAFGALVATASTAAASAPSAPALRTVTAGPNVASMSLRWTAPHANGGVLITGYEYRLQIDGGPFGPAVTLASADERKATVPCLAPAAPAHGCTYEIRATNGTPGAWSVPVGATWLPPTAAILGRADAGPAVGAATLTWLPPKKSGGLAVDYEYEVNTGSGWSTPASIDPESITTVLTPRVELSAIVPCPVVSGAGNPCSYLVVAQNGAGAGPPSRTRATVLKHPGQPTGVQVFTSAVALGTGAASQSISWTPPTNTGGLPITDEVVWACSTATGSACEDYSPGWVLVADLTGDPLASSITYDCPSNGRCAYEVWARNAKGRAWTIGKSDPGAPSNLIATVSTTTPGEVDLQWLNVTSVGSAFGNYVVFACEGTQNCSSGTWTNVPGDAAPWTRTELSGTATSAEQLCTPSITCTLRVGYIDASGAIGGVSNAVLVTP